MESSFLLLEGKTEEMEHIGDNLRRISKVSEVVFDWYMLMTPVDNLPVIIMSEFLLERILEHKPVPT